MGTTETIMIAAALKYGMAKDELTAEHPRVSEIPFESGAKLMTTINLIEGKTVVIVKGSPDILFERCIWSSGDARKAAEQANNQMAKDALRVLAVGYKVIENVPVELLPDEIENGLTFGGLVGMIDPPRPEVKAAIEECNTAGIRTIMITGDHVMTASAIARELGILSDDSEAITGAELANLTDERFTRTSANTAYTRGYRRPTKSG